MNLGIICPSEIAARRFLPALKKVGEISLAGVGVYTPEERFGSRLPSPEAVAAALAEKTREAEEMIREGGGRIYPSYEALVTAPEVDAVYLPLPPALHVRYARLALEHGKHVMLEKPAALSLRDTRELIALAKKRRLALHENYMFVYHNRMTALRRILERGEIGRVRLFRLSFGFPKRAAGDFRYSPSLGGGALNDAGGYPLRCAFLLLGPSAKVVSAVMNTEPDCPVDLYGSGTLVNAGGVTAQIAFGMDQDYRCDLEVWGSEGSLKTGRVFTAPPGFEPTVTLSRNGKTEERSLPADDAFEKSIRHFLRCTEDADRRAAAYEDMLLQAKLVDSFRRLAGAGSK